MYETAPSPEHQTSSTYNAMNLIVEMTIRPEAETCESGDIRNALIDTIEPIDLRVVKKVLVEAKSNVDTRVLTISHNKCATYRENNKADQPRMGVHEIFDSCDVAVGESEYSHSNGTHLKVIKFSWFHYRY